MGGPGSFGGASGEQAGSVGTQVDVVSGVSERRSRGFRRVKSLNMGLFVDWYFSWPEFPFEGDHKGSEIVEWYHQLFQNATTFASILASVMFSAMVLDLNTVAPQYGSTSQVRTWSAIGAILFVLLVLICQGFSLMLKFHGTEFERLYDNKDLATRILLACVSLQFQGLLLTGTLFFCLVVKSYVPAAGWTAFGITSWFLLLSLLLWLRRIAWELWSQLRARDRGWQIPTSSVEAEVHEAKQQESMARMVNDGSDAGNRTVEEAQAILQRAETELARIRSAQVELDETRVRSGLLKEGNRLMIGEGTAKDSLKQNNKGLRRRQTDIQPFIAGVAARPGEGHPTPVPRRSTAPVTRTRGSAESEKEEDPDLIGSATRIPPRASAGGGENTMDDGDMV